MKVLTKQIATQLSYLPKIELEAYCRDCGMTEREIGATIDYVYHHVKMETLCMRLGMSRSTFMRREKVLAIRLLRYMVETGKIDQIESGHHAISEVFEP